MNILKNKKNAEKKITDKRDKRCELVAKEIIQIIAKHNVDPKESDAEQQFKIYSPISKDINILMKENNLSIAEVNYTWSIVQAVLDSVKQYSVGAVQGAFELAEQKLLAVDNTNNVTLQQIDNVLLLK
jgi:hypothetical protein